MSDHTYEEPERDDTDLPDWLAKAEAARDDEALVEIGKRALTSKGHAAEVNRKLAALGIEPISPATVGRNGELVPAKLTNPDYEAYEVHATWDANAQLVRLLVGDWEDSFTGLEPSQTLWTLADVAHARNDGPTRHPASIRVRHPDLRGAAMKGVKPGPGNTSEDTAAILAGLGSLTAAVLHLADTVARTNAQI
jgi:hypothetical protein